MTDQYQCCRWCKNFKQYSIEYGLCKSGEFEGHYDIEKKVTDAGTVKVVEDVGEYVGYCVVIKKPEETYCNHFR